LRAAGGLFLGLAAAGCNDATAPPPAFPAASAATPVPEAVAREIAEGTARYRGALAAHGEWRADERFGSRWCPSQDAALAVNGSTFVPFRTGGRWQRSDGAPVWIAGEPGSWQDLTAHAGWWVRQDGIDAWCWLPGTSAHPGRVGWRAGGGYVGWVPLGPTDEAEQVPSRAWTFTFLGALHEDRVSPLVGDAADVALSNTMPLPGEAPASTLAPRAEAVDDARAELASHLAYHGHLRRSVDPLPPSMLVWDALLVHPMRGPGAVVAHAGPEHIAPLVKTEGRFGRRRGVLALPGGRTVFHHAQVPTPPPAPAPPRVGTVVPASPAAWSPIE
jgi:hypothetical protein